jgi:tape measure domain-containing protein
MADVASLTLRIVSSQAQAASDRMDASLQRLDDTAKMVGKTMQGLGLRLTAAVTVPLVLTGKAALKASAEYEKARISFGVFVNDMERGAQVFDEIVTLAAKTPLNVSSLQQSSQILLATGAATADTLMPILKSLGDVSRADSAILQRLALNLGQVASQGKLTGRELRDFAVAGVPLMQTLATQMNKSTEQIRKMVSSGQIGFGDVLKAFRAMSGEGGKFNNLMAKLANTLAGKWTTAVDNVRITLSTFADEFREQMKGVLDIVINTAQWFNRLTPQIKRVIVVAALIAASLGPALFILGKMITTIVMMKAAFALAGVAVIPLLVVIAKVVAVVGLIALAVEGVRRAFGITWSEIGTGMLNFAKKTIGFIANIRTNWGLLTEWLGRNWENLLGDFVFNTIMFANNVIKNMGVMFQTIVLIAGTAWDSVLNNWELTLGNMIEKADEWVGKIASVFARAGRAAIDSWADAVVRIALPGVFTEEDKSRQQVLIDQNKTLGDKIAKIWEQATFVGLTDGFRKTTEALPQFLTNFDFFGGPSVGFFDNAMKFAEDTLRRYGLLGDGAGAAGGGSRSSKLAGALEAGSTEAFKLIASQRDDGMKKIQTKNLSANEQTAMGMRSLLNDGLKVTGIKEVQSIK